MALLLADARRQLVVVVRQRFEPLVCHRILTGEPGHLVIVVAKLYGRAGIKGIVDQFDRFSASPSGRCPKARAV